MPLNSIFIKCKEKRDSKISICLTDTERNFKYTGFAKELQVMRQIIAALAKDWLYLPIQNVLYGQPVVFTKSLAELFQMLQAEESGGTRVGLVLIDIFAYGENYRSIIRNLRAIKAGVPIIALLAPDETRLSASLEHFPDCYSLAIDRLNHELRPLVQQIWQSVPTTPATQVKQRKTEVQAMAKNQDSILDCRVDRRNFLKGAAAAAAVVGVSTVNPDSTLVAEGIDNSTVESTEPTIETKISACRGGGCFGCVFECLVVNDNLVRTKAKQIPGYDQKSTICARGASWPHQVNSPMRIKYPMKRAGERGEDKWERITWEEALSTIGTKIKGYWAEYGKKSVAHYGMGGNYSAEAMWMFTRFSNVGEFLELEYLMDMTMGQANYLTMGSNSINPETIPQLKTYIAWGCNVVETGYPGLGPSGPNAFRFIADGIENGMEFICIDPMYNTTAAKAQKWISPRSGTDAAMAMAMINYLEEQQLVDEAFLRSQTVAPFLIKNDGRFLRLSDLMPESVTAGTPDDDFVVWDSQAGTYGSSSTIAAPEIRGSFIVEGRDVTTAYSKLLERTAPFTLELSAEICDVPVADIIYVAEALAKNRPANMYAGTSMDHYVNGHGIYVAINALRMVAGAIEPGIVTPRLDYSGFTAEEKEHPVISGKISTLMFEDLINTGRYELPGGAVVEAPLKALLVLGGNIIHNQPSYHKTLEYLKSLDFVVVANPEFGDVTLNADIVLPVTTQQEVEGIYYNHGLLVYLDQVITPRFEAKTDFEIIKLLAQELGLGEYFNFDLDHVLRSAMQNNAVFDAHGITYEKLKQEKVIVIPYTEMPAISTMTGRYQFYIETFFALTDFGQKYDVDKLRLPYFEPPNEAWTQTVGPYKKNPLADKYPLQYLTGPRRFRIHTQFGNEPILRELEGTDPVVRMNPADAAARGIKEGDYVKIYNDRGYVIVRAVHSTCVRRGMVDMDRSWQQHNFKEGHYQYLTNRAIEWGTPSFCWYDTLCEVEKV
jgi:molybdopterin-containing oxidoreductase family molybdopterin binding subunit